MSEAAPDVRRLLHLLAVHPVAPPMEALPPNDEAFQALVADLARGERSTHAETLRAVAEDLVIPAEELARRAEFLLACLVLPASGTYYDLLGVARDASPQEIRKRWAGLIQRYHPDRVGGASGWLDGQARRLIEAYQTLKDPDRRREYDRQLALSSPLPPPGRGPGEGIAWLRRARLGRGWVVRVSSRWRWAPAGILAVGVALGVWAYTRPVPRLSQSAPVPSAPGPLEAWRRIESGRDTTPLTRPGGAERERGSTASRSPSGVAGSEPVELPSFKDRLPAIAPPRGRGQDGAPSSPVPSVGRGRGEGAPTPLPAASAPERPMSAAQAGRVEPAPPTPLNPEPGGPVQPSTPAAVSPPAPPPSPVAAGPASPTPGIAEASASRPSEAAPPTARPSVPPPIPVPAAATAAAKPEPPPAPVAAAIPSAPPVPRDEPLALVDAFRRAYERKDLRAVMGFLGAQPRDGSLLGRGPIEQQYASTFASLDKIRYELADLDVRGGATVGDVVVQGRFRIRASQVQPLAGPLDVGGPIRWTLRREGGALRIVGIAYELASR